jgi:arsenate reductase
MGVTRIVARKRLYFICTGNSCRSQMAEGLARMLLPRDWDVASGGLEPKPVHPLAIQVMAEWGIDISGHRSKPIDPEWIATADTVVTLCGDARDRCPVLPPGTHHLHWGLPDPAAAAGSPEAVLNTFRSVRDQIRDRLEQWVARLP